MVLSLTKLHQSYNSFVYGRYFFTPIMEFTMKKPMKQPAKKMPSKAPAKKAAPKKATPYKATPAKKSTKAGGMMPLPKKRIY